MSIPIYDFPSSPILIIGALGIALAIVVFFVAYQKYFNSPLNKEIAAKKKALIKEHKYPNSLLLERGDSASNKDLTEFKNYLERLNLDQLRTMSKEFIL